MNNTAPPIASAACAPSQSARNGVTTADTSIAPMARL